MRGGCFYFKIFLSHFFPFFCMFGKATLVVHTNNYPFFSLILEPQTRRRRRRVRLNSDLTGSDLSDAGSGLDSNLSNDAEGLDRVSDSPPDLSLSDL